MSEVFINFESEKREGVIAVGSYLLDVAKRLGIKVECDCQDEEVETKGSCAMKVSKGKTLLSSPTKSELEQLSSQARKNGERLACQTKIEKSGEVTIMSVKKKQETAEKDEVKDRSEEYRKEFEKMPLEEKISSLIELEAMALNETFSFILNSPYEAVGKVMDVMAGFGLDMEKKAEDAKRPNEHKENEPKEEKEEKKEPAKKTTRRKTTKRKPAAKKTAAKKTTTKKTTAKKTTKKRTTRKRTTKKKEDE